MAGGPATVALAAAVCDAGGLGFLAAGYRGAPDVRDEMRAMGARRFGVNVFVPGPAPRPGSVDDDAVRAYVERLGPGAGEPRWDDDGWADKLALLRAEPPAVTSFTFGCPTAEEIASLGSEVWVTVTSVDEARRAVEAGADALVLQGTEAGGHRGSWVDRDDALGAGSGLGLLALIRLVAAELPGVPLVATGGIADAAGVAAVRAAGAAAAQAGTAFLLAPEAGTHPAHREAVRSDAPTALTRAFTGRLARGIENRFMREHSAHAPIAYPQVNHATAPLRARAREAGDGGGFNLWAGQAHALAVERPAAETVRALSP
jgi:nitronate monooxygenase